MALFDKDLFGNYLFLKKIVISAVGLLTYRRFNGINRLHIAGTEHLESLPSQNVLFLSNHQTYYADVIAFYHVFCSVRWGYRNSIKSPIYLLTPNVHSYFVAAEETMKNSGFIPRVLSYAGAVTVQRSWRSHGKEVERTVDKSAIDNIAKALQSGWVINFPQGTTSPYAPIRKGVVSIIKEHNPIIVPITINGFRRAFDKKGLLLKKKGTKLSVSFDQPFQFSPDENPDTIVEVIRKKIGQEDVMQKIREMLPKK